jgi:FtsZ-binding cell division protein ZapB
LTGNIPYTIIKKECILALEAINDLEAKIDVLINAFGSLKEERDTLKAENNDKANSFENLNEENRNLRKELQSLKEISDIQQSKVKTAAEKIQELISKLESVA